MTDEEFMNEYVYVVVDAYLNFPYKKLLPAKAKTTADEEQVALRAVGFEPLLSVQALKLYMEVYDLNKQMGWAERFDGVPCAPVREATVGSWFGKPIVLDLETKNPDQIVFANVVGSIRATASHVMVGWRQAERFLPRVIEAEVDDARRAMADELGHKMAVSLAKKGGLVP